MAYQIEIDNHGRRVIREEGYSYYLTVDGRLMREGFRQIQARNGHVWQTPERRQVRHTCIFAALTEAQRIAAR